MQKLLPRLTKPIYGFGDTGFSCHSVGAADAGIHRLCPCSRSAAGKRSIGNSPGIGPIPAALLCIGIIFAALYLLSCASHWHIVEILEARRSGLFQN